MPLTIITKNSTTASKRPTAAQLVTGELGLNVESTDPGLYFEDSAGAIRKVGGAHYGATAPNAAAAGQAGNSVGELWYNTTASQLSVWNGTAWTTAGGADTHSFVSDTALTTRPDGTALVNGDMWFDSAKLLPFVWYDDGTSQQWVSLIAGSIAPLNSTQIAATAPTQRPDTTALQAGDTWYNTTNKGLYVYDGAAWQLVRDPDAGLSTQAAAAAPTTRPDGTALVEGDLYYDTVTDAIYAWDGAAWVAVGGGGGTAATLAEAAAGTLNTVYSSPQTAVPKDASGMTGAAIIPSGTDLQRPGTPVVGMQRYNTDSQFEEVYTGATLGWRKLAYEATPATLPADLTLTSTSYSGVYVCNNLTVPAGVTATVSSYDATFICYGDVVIDGTINADGVGGWGSAGVETLLGAAASGAPFGPGSRPGYRAPGVVPQGTYSPVVAVYGTGGWGGAAQNTASPGQTAAGNGGNGGGGILIRSYGSITMSATGVLSANGTNAFGGAIFSGTGNLSGGGGGTGGCIILHADGNITLAGTLSATGGNGSNGADNVGGALGGQGGCGAAGGYIILQTPATLTDTSTKNLAGGSPGATYGSSGGQLFAAYGSSFGGVGGSAAVYASPTGGSAGVVAYSGSPL